MRHASEETEEANVENNLRDLMMSGGERERSTWRKTQRMILLQKARIKHVECIRMEEVKANAGKANKIPQNEEEMCSKEGGTR